MYSTRIECNGYVCYLFLVNYDDSIAVVVIVVVIVVGNSISYNSLEIICKFIFMFLSLCCCWFCSSVVYIIWIILIKEVENIKKNNNNNNNNKVSNSQLQVQRVYTLQLNRLGLFWSATKLHPLQNHELVHYSSIYGRKDSPMLSSGITGDDMVYA